ncbi:MAG: S4 domain-containing protein, partial [Rhizorhabdus sp.]
EEGASGAGLPSMVAPGATPRVGVGVGLGVAASKGEARRLIKGGGARIDGEKVADEAATVTVTEAPVRISAGKKHHGMVNPA